MNESLCYLSEKCAVVVTIPSSMFKLQTNPKARTSFFPNFSDVETIFLMFTAA
jgi:hypothetical protein